MARVQPNIIPDGAAPEIHGTDSFIVRTKKLWGGSDKDAKWKAVPYLTPLSARSSVGPSVSRAAFQYEYGENTREDAPAFKVQPPLDLKDQFIQIVLVNDRGTSVVWTGVITDRVYDVDSSFDDPEALDEEPVRSGRQTIIAYGLEHLLDLVTIRGGHIWNAKTSEVDKIAHLPIFNERRRYGMGLSGNRSTSPTEAGTHVFSEGGAVWTNEDILEYLLHYHMEQWGEAEDDLKFEIAGQPALLHNIVTLHKLEGFTVLQAVNHLIARHRGIGWYVDAPGDMNGDTLLATPGKVTLHIFGIFEKDITVDGTTMRGNRQNAAPSFDHLDTKRALIKHSTSARYDRIVVQGARVKSCFSVSFADGTLEAGWTATEENDYNAALGTDPDLNDAFRQEDARSRVYQVYRIPRDFGWMVRNGRGKSNYYIAHPAVKDDGRVDSQTTAKYWNANRALLRALPIMMRPGAADTEPEALMPLVIVVNPDDGKYYQVEGLKAIEKPPARVRMLDGEMAFSVVSAIGHVLGLNSFDPTVDGPSKVQPAFDWKEMIATVFAETDERLKVIRSVPNFAELARPRTLTLNVPDAELWYIPLMTTISISEGAREFWAGGYNTLRDDGPRLRLIAALAMEWYRQERTAIEIQLNNLRPGFRLGTIVTAIGDETNHTTVGTPISAISWDFVHGRSSYQTSFWELDAVRMADVPGMSNLRAVARTVHGMQNDLVELRRHVGMLPVRWPGVTASSIQFGKGQHYADEHAEVAWKETEVAGIAEVKIKFCGEDGGDVTGDAFSVYCYHPTSEDPNIRVGMVVPYTVSKTGRLVTLDDFGDDKIGTIKMWAIHTYGTPDEVPDGWHVCDGTGTINMDGKLVVAHDTTETLPDYDNDVGSGGDLDIISAGYDDPMPFMVLGFIQRVN